MQDFSNVENVLWLKIVFKHWHKRNTGLLSALQLIFYVNFTFSCLLCICFTSDHLFLPLQTDVYPKPYVYDYLKIKSVLSKKSNKNNYKA